MVFVRNTVLLLQCNTYIQLAISATRNEALIDATCGLNYCRCLCPLRRVRSTNLIGAAAFLVGKDAEGRGGWRKATRGVVLSIAGSNIFCPVALCRNDRGAIQVGICLPEYPLQSKGLSGEAGKKGGGRGGQGRSREEAYSEELWEKCS